MPFCVMGDLLCPSAFFCHSHGQSCIGSVSCFKQTCAYRRGLFISQRRGTTLQQGVTQWKQGSSPKCCTCSDVQAQIQKGNLCKDEDEASDVFSVSHNPAIIITPYANAEEVGNYSQACFTLLVLPDLRFKHNSARLHRKYRAKPHRQALSKGLCWLWGQGLGRALQGDVPAQKALRAMGCILLEGKAYKKLRFYCVCSNTEKKLHSESETTH